MVSLTWSRVSGPGSVSFANPHNQATSATFSSGGSYLLRLLADDGQVQTAADVTVTVITRPVLWAQLLPNAVQLSWQTTGGNWQLQCQTNTSGTGLGANWSYIAGPVTNPFVLPLDFSGGSVFCRLVLTNF